MARNQPPKEGVCPLPTRAIVERVVLFTETVNKRIFYRYQKEFARRIVQSVLRRDGSTITGIFSRQSGKTEIVACLGLAMTLIIPALAKAFPNDPRFNGFEEGFAVGIFAPTAKHSGIIYGRMKARVESLDFVDILNDEEVGTTLAHSRGDSFAFTNGSRVEANTASENVLNEGGTYHLILIDETQKIGQAKINKELNPMLASTNGSMVMIGTALMSGGAFYKAIMHNKAVEKQTGVRNHFEFDYLRVIKDRKRQYERDQKVMHLHYENWVNGELKRLGGNIDADAFKMNFRLLWGSAGAQFVSMNLFRSLRNTSLEMNQPWLGPGVIAASLDVAKTNDSSWLTVGVIHTDRPITEMVSFAGSKPQPVTYYNRTILGWWQMGGLFEGANGQYMQAVNFLRMYPRLSTFMVDSTGMGDPIAERFAILLPGVDVVPFKFSMATKSTMYKNYLMELEAKRIRYAAGAHTQGSHVFEEFEGQHETLVKNYIGQYLSCKAADEDDHDDAPDSAAMFASIEPDMINAVPFVDVSTGQAIGGGVGQNAVPQVDLSSGPQSRMLRGNPRRYR